MGGAAIVWKTVFNSVLGNFFWFHPALDAAEPDSRVIELTSAFVLIVFAVGIYYLANDWNSTRTTRSG
jgi:Na+-transporting NADH:ubiquinone oxidoreductase subunit NqrB